MLMLVSRVSAQRYTQVLKTPKSRLLTGERFAAVFRQIASNADRRPVRLHKPVSAQFRPAGLGACGGYDGRDGLRSDPEMARMQYDIKSILPLPSDLCRVCCWTSTFGNAVRHALRICC
jgi:hypothetical protein